MNILYVALGWVLGIMSTVVVDLIRREHRRRDLMRSIVSELVDLQYMMAVVAYLMRRKDATIDDKFLDWLNPILARYDGPWKLEKLKEALAKSRELPEEQRRQIHLHMIAEERGSALKQYSLPFLESVSNELPLCSLDFQRRVLHVKGSLDLFNQHVSFLQAQFMKTFAVADKNHEAVRTNLSDGYSQLAGTAVGIADAISEIPSLFRPSWFRPS